MSRRPVIRKAAGKATAAYDHLKAFAINGQLSPGRRLAPEKLTTHFGFSSTPIRDAMAQLAFEGFLTRGKNHSYFFKAYTVEEQAELHTLGFIYMAAGVHCGAEQLPTDLLEELAALDPHLAERDDAAAYVTEKLEMLYREFTSASRISLMVGCSRMIVERTHLVRLLDMNHPSTAAEAIRALKGLATAVLNGDLNQGVEFLRKKLNARLAHLPALVAQANHQAQGAQFP